jgi:hypothetical protein
VGITALARAFRCKRLLESGEFAAIAELAEHEEIAPSYMTQVLRLTLLAPDIVEAILNGTQGQEMSAGRYVEAILNGMGATAIASRSALEPKKRRCNLG